MSVNGEDLNLPPPSQSHFAKFEDFTPNDDAPFDDEFKRLALSQNWTAGSQQYTRERTIAMREELKLHYFPPSQPLDDTDEKVTEEDKLKGYQDLCHEVGIPPRDSIVECKKLLKNTLVNIIDLIDARRTHKKVEVWHNFNAFRKYTLQPQHRISMDEANEGEGYLASLLQYLRNPRRGGRGRRSDGFRSRVVSGRVARKSRA